MKKFRFASVEVRVDYEQGQDWVAELFKLVPKDSLIKWSTVEYDEDQKEDRLPLKDADIQSRLSK